MSVAFSTSSLRTKGYLDLPIPKGIDLKEAILELKAKKNAVLLAHYYQTKDIQEIADYLGDSLYLAKAAQRVDADIIVFAAPLCRSRTWQQGASRHNTQRYHSRPCRRPR